MLTAILALLLLPHHSVASDYDIHNVVTLKGTVTKVEWMNPHIYFYIDVKQNDGTVSSWAIEAGAPNALYRNGWTKDSVKAGDTITVKACLAKNGSNLANMRSAVLANGKKVTGTPFGDER
jgi:hypothetical protein